MKIYISGPITGYADLNRPAFENAARELQALGHQTLNPFENGLSGDSSWNAHMRADIKMLMDADAVCVLDGWTRSKGAKIEIGIANALGIEHRLLEDWQ